MARKTIVVSDLSGKPVAADEAVTVTIRYADARRGIVVLDANASEVENLARSGTKQRPRGRPRRVNAGDYINEGSSGSRPIEGVGTSIAARGRPKGARTGTRRGRPRRT